MASKLRAGIADGIDEDGRNADIDQGGLERADTRHFEVIHQIAGGEHGADTDTVAFIGGIKELQPHFGRRERHAIEFEVADFLHGAVGDGHVSNDRLADIGLPDTH
jgi:hypothetical protein